MAIDASVRLRWIQAGALAGMIVLAVVLLLPAVQQAREASRRVQSRNNLKQIGLALGNYHDTHQCFPPGGTFDESGRDYHGWAIQLMPYLDSAPLQSQIDFKQPWDSPRNAEAFRIRLRPFINPSINPSYAVGGNLSDFWD